MKKRLIALVALLSSLMLPVAPLPATENPFAFETPTVDIWRALDLMKDFKISSIILFVLLGIVSLLLYRRFLKTKGLKSNRLKVFLSSNLIYYLATLFVNICLYFLAVHYGWMGYSELNRAVNSSEMWPQISKTLSLGLGSFHIAHALDALFFSVVFFTAAVFIVAKFKSRTDS